MYVFFTPRSQHEAYTSCTIVASGSAIIPRAAIATQNPIMRTYHLQQVQRNIAVASAQHVPRFYLFTLVEHFHAWLFRQCHLGQMN